MKALIAAVLGLGIALSGTSFAQEKKEVKKAPSAAQKKQQERMRDCNEKAADMKGEERKKFMSACLGAPAEKGAKKMTEQQQRMATCNREAGAKGLKGDARKTFMSDCLKG